MDIKETTFPATRYLALKKSISTEQITDKQMYDDAGKKLGAYMQLHGLKPSGPWTVLYFTWDEAAKKTDIAIAFPIAEGLSLVSDVELSAVDVEEAKASLSVMHGSYEGLGETHHGLMQYVLVHGLAKRKTPVMAIEEYAVGPMDNPDPSNWITNVYYLHD